MAEQDVEWWHAGISTVKDNRIRIPNRLFEEESIVTPGRPAFWSYEAVVGIVIVSNRELEDEEYESVDFNKMGGDDDNYRCTIPSGFFEETSEKGNPAASYTVPERARVENGERRHFMYTTEIAEGDIKSCYVLTDQEFNDRFKNSDTWDGTLDQVPQFL